MSRLYEPIWRSVKDTGTCSIAAPSPLHSRIIKAVKKEKDKDLGFKVIMAEEGRAARLQITVQKAKITFRLIKSIGTADL